MANRVTGISASSRSVEERLIRILSPQARAREQDALERVSYAAGTGSAVTDLIFSIAKREVTFFSETTPISFL